MGIYIGSVIADAAREAHIAIHDLTLKDVRDLVQWPARPLSAKWENDEPHGPRLVVKAYDGRGRRILVALDPVPWHDGQSAETWSVRTAFAET